MYSSEIKLCNRTATDSDIVEPILTFDASVPESIKLALSKLSKMVSISTVSEGVSLITEGNLMLERTSGFFATITSGFLERSECLSGLI